MPPKRKSGAKSESAAAKKSKSEAKVEEKEEKKIQTVVVKGCAPVDVQCPLTDTCHIYTDGGVIYDAMLNQTNLQFNNNKYYVIQLLETDSAPIQYNVWFRWGRVGKDGMTKLERHGTSVDKAIASFKKKFSDKTRNVWPCTIKNFTKVKGKYDLLEMDYSSSAEGSSGAGDKSKDKAAKKDFKSKLSDAVFRLIDLICDIKVMENTVVEMKYDCKKAPLGRLTKEQIKAGFSALKQIEEYLQEAKEKSGGGKRTGSGRKVGGSSGVRRDLLVQACNDFYTRIPHDFGMRVPPLINTLDEVKEKLQLLEALSDIEIAMQILKDDAKEQKEHPADRHYSALKCSLDAIEHDDDEFLMVQKYLLNTHATTHSMYTMELLDAFKCEKEGEDARFKDLGNKKLLWHGSRLSNWMGILSQGLRIAPPEAPSTGYMFGKGVYFADMSSKSANYTYANRMNNVGLLVLCEVSLGNPNKLLRADLNANKLPAGCHSVMGQGRTMPDPDQDLKMPDGVVVPYGKPKDTGITNPSGYTLLYNEYIVYDTSQIRMRYLLKVKFNYK